MDKKDSKPKFVEKKGCTYTFWWEHHLACPRNSSHLITQDSCMVIDQDLDHVYDLRPLKFKVFMAKNDNTKFLSICSSLNNSSCGSKSVSACLQDSSTGGFKNIGNVNDRLTLQGDEPVLHYDNEFSHTSIHFKCQVDAINASTYLIFIEQIKNHYYFELYTPLACPKNQVHETCPKNQTSCPASESQKTNHSSRVTSDIKQAFLCIIFIMGFMGLVFLNALRTSPHLRETIHSKIIWAWTSLCLLRRGRDDDNLIENNVNIPTFGGLGVAEDEDEDLILA